MLDERRLVRCEEALGHVPCGEIENLEDRPIVQRGRALEKDPVTAELVNAIDRGHRITRDDAVGALRSFIPQNTLAMTIDGKDLKVGDARDRGCHAELFGPGTRSPEVPEKAPRRV